MKVNQMQVNQMKVNHREVNLMKIKQMNVNQMKFIPKLIEMKWKFQWFYGIEPSNHWLRDLIRFG